MKKIVLLLIVITLTVSVFGVNNQKIGFGKKFVGVDARMTTNDYPIGYGQNGSIYSYMISVFSEIKLPKTNLIDLEIGLSGGMSHSRYDSGYTFQMSVGAFFNVLNGKVGVVFLNTQTEILTTYEYQGLYYIIKESGVIIAPKICMDLYKKIGLHGSVPFYGNGSIQAVKVGLRYRF